MELGHSIRHTRTYCDHCVIRVEETQKSVEGRSNNIYSYPAIIRIGFLFQPRKHTRTSHSSSKHFWSFKKNNGVKLLKGQSPTALTQWGTDPFFPITLSQWQPNLSRCTLIFFTFKFQCSFMLSYNPETGHHP